MDHGLHAFFKSPNIRSDLGDLFRASLGLNIYTRYNATRYYVPASHVHYTYVVHMKSTHEDILQWLSYFWIMFENGLFLLGSCKLLWQVGGQFQKPQRLNWSFDAFLLPCQ